MTAPDRLVEAIHQCCLALYAPEVAHSCSEQLIQMLESSALWHQCEPLPPLSEAHVLLITYANSIEAPGEMPLVTLRRMLKKHLSSMSHVHLLPFFPYSSDDGFSVIDFSRVDTDLGDWSHIEALAQSHQLMFDFVLNHISRESVWFADFVAHHPPGKDYFIEVPRDTDVSQVVRPRSQRLLTPIYTRRGIEHVWATFSADQIDLNYANPDVLLAMMGILMQYLERGASMIRLDAVAFLWKQLGTSCVNLAQTHAVVRLMRLIADALKPGCLLVSETNVPHQENLSYFGHGDEAHLVYQFALPPLLLYTFNRGNADLLTNWAQTLAPPPPGCTFMNFAASHDGIGLRALEGILPHYEVSSLIESMQQFGGTVSMRGQPDGTDAPYEINISYFDALMGTRLGPDQWQVERFICAQTILLTLQGLPALYIHSLLATPNDHKGVARTGRLRSINRRRWQWQEIESLLEQPQSTHSRVCRELQRRVALRKTLPMLSPSAGQRILDLDSRVFVVQREQAGTRMLGVFNVTAREVRLPLTKVLQHAQQPALDVLAQQHYEAGTELELQPYQALWLYPAHTEVCWVEALTP